MLLKTCFDFKAKSHTYAKKSSYLSMPHAAPVFFLCSPFLTHVLAKSFTFHDCLVVPLLLLCPYLRWREAGASDTCWYSDSFRTLTDSAAIVMPLNTLHNSRQNMVRDTLCTILGAVCDTCSVWFGRLPVWCMQDASSQRKIVHPPDMNLS